MQDIPASCNKNDTDMKDIRKRRESTSIRDAEVHSLYKKILWKNWEIFPQSYQGPISTKRYVKRPV